MAIETEVTIEKWIYGGDALSRIEGRVALTPFVLPGELVRVESEQEKAGLLRMRPLEVLSKSAERADPPCPYFYRCGGCQYQHAGYEFQVAQKAAILREQLRRVGKIDYAGPIETITGPPLGYRNRSQFHIERRRIGYFAESSHHLVPIERCPISSPKLNEALTALLEMVRDRRFPDFIRVIELFTNETDVLVNVLSSQRPVARRFFEWCAGRIPGASRGSLDYEVGGDRFQVSHNSFFQVNRFLLDQLVAEAIRGAEGTTALDLYAGVGLFSLPLARRFAKVTAVEAAKSAARDLSVNADRAGVTVQVSQSNVERYLPGVTEPPDFVLADPPRPGLGKRVVVEILRLQPRRLTIVSCDPSTLSRDLAQLTNGGYTLDRLVMVDLFPQTYHLEAIAHLSPLGRGARS